jgi:RNA polymerase-binding protein DksA
MNKADLEYFKGLIIKKKEELLSELGYLETSSMSSTSKDQSGDLSSYSYHMADQGSDTMEREMAFSMASREGRYLHHLDEALERIESGTYGICRSCGKEISKTRLEAVPNATQCIDCKTVEEKKQKGL